LLKLSFIFPILATVAAIYHLYQATRVWRESLFRGVWARIRYSIVTLAALSLGWFYFHWHLLGFNYYS
jgi:hypothetical protein